MTVYFVGFFFVKECRLQSICVCDGALKEVIRLGLSSMSGSHPSPTFLNTTAPGTSRMELHTTYICVCVFAQRNQICTYFGVERHFCCAHLLHSGGVGGWYVLADSVWFVSDLSCCPLLFNVLKSYVGFLICYVGRSKIVPDETLKTVWCQHSLQVLFVCQWQSAAVNPKWRSTSTQVRL